MSTSTRLPESALLAITCPTCWAVPGQGCTITHRTDRKWCNGRVNAAKKKGKRR